MSPSNTHARVATDEEMQLFRQFFLNRIGMQLPDSKRMLLSSRLSKRLDALGLDSFRAYHKLISTPAEDVERQRAIDLITTNETYFFREPQHFDFLRSTVLPERETHNSFRVWSAACSTGEEPYTLAMLLDEVRGHRPWEIEATDISSRVLSFAKRGLFTEKRGEYVPPALKKRYCLRGTGEYQGHFLVDPTIRSRVNFRPMNLMELERSIGQFDVIFLRNVLIYFDLPTKTTVVNSILRHLKPQGYFIIGAAESLQGISHDLHHHGKSIFQRRG